MLVFSAFTPHSPLLMPSINPDHRFEITGVVRALEACADALYATHPDTVVLFAESNTMYQDAFSVNVADPFTADLSAFGDLGHTPTYHPDIALIDALQRELRKNGVPLSLSTDHKLSFASAIPLHYLSAALQGTKIIHITPSGMDLKAHFALGSAVKNIIMHSNKRIAVIASGDMAHVEGEAGTAFMDKMRNILQEKNTGGLLQLDPTFIQAAEDTSVRQIAMLFGVLDGVDTKARVLSLETQLGVGYGVATYSL